MSISPTTTEHSAGQRRPGNNPYPFDDIVPRSPQDDLSSPSAIPDFCLKSTPHSCRTSSRFTRLSCRSGRMKSSLTHASGLLRSYGKWSCQPVSSSANGGYFRAKAANHPVYPEVLRISRQDPEAIYLDLGYFCGYVVQSMGTG